MRCDVYALLSESLLVSYFNIVRKNILDSIPKAIMNFLVNKSKSEIQNELVSQLYKEEYINSLLKESEVVAARRKHCKVLVETLKKANSILSAVRDYNIEWTNVVAGHSCRHI